MLRICLTARVDAVSLFLLGVAEAGTQRFLLVGSVDALRKLSTENPPTLIGEEVERRPRDAVVDALVQTDRIIRSAAITELQTDVRHLHRPMQRQLESLKPFSSVFPKYPH